MSTGGGHGGAAPIDHDLLDDMRSYLARSDRFQGVEAKPEDNPDALVCHFDTGFYPSTLEEVFLELVWYRNNDFTIHYREDYTGGDAWECRWDRHPNSHNDREHFHPGPDASRVNARDETYPSDWRDVVERVLRETDTRRAGFWSATNE
jgi:hypothetical protein